MKDRADLGRLHVITDVTLQSRFSHAELGRIVALAGADVVQYRDKRPLGRDEHLRQACELRAALDRVPLVVNDQVEVARTCRARGVHLGHADTPWRSARRLLGPRYWIGATANSLDRAIAADVEAVDYLGVGPVFGTSSKTSPAAPVGVAGLRRIVESVSKPVIAIGGIGPDNVAAVLEAGVHGIAVLSAVVCCEDPAGAVGSLRRGIDRCIAESLLPAARGGSR